MVRETNGRREAVIAKPSLPAILLFAVIAAATALSSCGDSGSNQNVSPAARLEALDRNLQAVEAGERAARRDRWDPDDVVRQVGRDPQHLFAWVQNNTSWIPYRGVLRGPIGVLMDGQGNSLDQSLLLAKLLEIAGHSVRLAHADLDQAQAAQLLPDLVARQALAFSVKGETDTTLAQNLQRTATTFLAGGSEAGRAIAAQNVAADQALTKLNKRSADQTAWLLGMTPQHDAMQEWGTRLASALQALQDHWWVQRWNGTAWVDMDLLSEGADGASPLAPAADVVALKDLATAVPHQEIAVRVIAEQLADGAVAQHTALEQVLRPSDLIGQSIVLQFWPTAEIESSASAAPKDKPKSDYKSTELGQHEWVGLLLIGREAKAAALLPDSGEDPDAPQKGGAFGGMAGAFEDTMQTKNAGSAASRHGTLSAVWLEYEIRVPGQEPRTIRRTVFDLIGPAARASGTPLTLTMTDTMRLTRATSLRMRSEILPIASRIAPDFVAHLVAQNVLGNRDLVHNAAQADKSLSTGDNADPVTEAVPSVSTLYALAIAQQPIGDARLSFIDRPQILTQHAYLKPDGDGAALIEATDIVANEVGVSLAAPDAYAIRLAQGVRDTNAEALLYDEGRFGNAADALAQSTSWVTLNTPDEAAVGRLALPADVRRRILDDLSAGNMVVAPTAAIAMKPAAFAGWWRINPATGDALGLGENGWGQVAAEEGANDSRAAVWKRKFLKIGKRFTQVFVGGYGFCLAAQIVQNTEATHSARMGLKLGFSNSVSECVGDSAFVGALATVPLLVRNVNQNGGMRVPAPPEPPNVPNGPKVTDPPCNGIGGNRTQPMPNAPPRPDMRGTQPMPGAPPRPSAGGTQRMPNASPRPGDTQPIPGAPPRPNPGGTQPMPGAPSPPEVAEGAPQPRPSGQAGSVNSNNPPKLNPNEPVNNAPEENNSPQRNRPPNAQAELAAARGAVAEAERVYAEKSNEASQANANSSPAVRANFKKNGEWIRYKARGRSDSPFYDPANYDPKVEAELKAAADAATAESEPLVKKSMEAQAALDAAQKSLKSATDGLGRLESREQAPKEISSNAAQDAVVKARADFVEAQRDYIEKWHALEGPEKEAIALRPAAIKKLGEALRLQAKGDPRSPEYDIHNYDANADQQAWQQADDAMRELHDAEVKWQKANDEYVRAKENYEFRQRVLDALQQAACK